MRLRRTSTGPTGRSRRSLVFSLNVYLNHDFEAGRTRFCSTTSDEVEYACRPEAGLALIFRQPPSAHYLHDGEPVRSGVKYLWRCDVMYRKA